MKVKLLPSKIGVCLLYVLWSLNAQAQMGDHVFSGAEASNFGVIDLATPGGQTWSTDRQALPGYFGATGTANYTGVSDAHNINGYVKHYATAVNQAFSFPVGSGSDYRSLSVSGTRTATSVVATAWIAGDPSGNLDPTAPAAGSHATTALGAGIQAVSSVGQWDWQDLSSDAAGLTITVSIPDLSAFGAATLLRLVGWNGTDWVNLSGNTGASDNTENSTLSGTMIVGITAIGIGVAIDSDNDGLADASDFDDDNDGIVDTVEEASACATTVVPTGTDLDCDGDGIANRLDLDSDGDGIKDAVEAGGTDADNDGKIGIGAPLVNASGVPTAANAGNGLTPINTDGIGGANPYDADSDGDGIADGVEDADKDGIVDAGETDPTKSDTDGDGIPDGVEDKDKDGVVDAGETDPTKSDTDGDSIADGVEDADKDGIVDAGETDPTKADTDGDTINDNVDQCALVVGVAPTGCPQLCISAKVYLQGALFGVYLPDSLMRDDLRTKGYLPTSSPYPAIGLTGITNANTSTAAVVGAGSASGKDAIVDWVFVELRSGADSTLIVDSRSALLQRDGDVVDVDGISPVKFTLTIVGSYYVVIRHRNHLGVMSKKVSLSSTCSTIDFRKSSTATFSFDATNSVNQSQVVVDQGLALWAGNALYTNAGDGKVEVMVQGTDNDVNMIYQQIVNASGNVFVSPFYKLRGYYSGDVNLDGEALLQSTNNDVEFIYQNAVKNHTGNGLVVPFFKIRQQIP